MNVYNVYYTFLDFPLARSALNATFCIELCSESELQNLRRSGNCLSFDDSIWEGSPE